MATVNSTLTQKRAKELLHYSKATGKTTWRVYRCGKAKAGTVAGGVNSRGYVEITIDDVGYKLHRVIWLYVTGEWPVNDIDHINHNKSDNRWSNLRDATRRTNSENIITAHKNNKTGFLGVYKYLDRFAAGIHVGTKHIHLGIYPTPEAAHNAYVKAKRRHHHGCTL